MPEEMGGRVLIIEDEPVVTEVLRSYLERESFAVVSERDGEKGLSQIIGGGFDVVILDLMLPGLDGLEICRRLRRQSDVPVLMLTARGEFEDRILGFGVGADDYVVKPFNAVEVVLRVKALVRRARPAPPERPVKDGAAGQVAGRLRFDGLEIDTAGRRVWRHGQEVNLTAREFDLLAFLANHPGVVFSRSQLIARVWGYEYAGDAGTVSVHVRRLREKLGDDPGASTLIRTVWGIGYRFDPPGDLERRGGLDSSGSPSRRRETARG